MVLKFFLYLLGTGFLFVLFVWYLEKVSVFYPSKNIVSTPAQLGLSYEDVFILTEDKVRIHGWWIPYPQAKDTVLIFHGNAGNIGDRPRKINIFNSLRVNTFVIDYRGYGKSEGKPTEQGIYLDALAAYDYLVKKQNVSASNVIVYGVSLGGAVAVDLASKRPVKAIIIDSSFTQAKDIAKIIYPFVPSFLMQTKLDSLSKITSIHAPKLFFHSTEDQTVPIRLGKSLYEAAPPPKEFIELCGGHDEGHDASLNIFVEALANFIQKI